MKKFLLLTAALLTLQSLPVLAEEGGNEGGPAGKGKKPEHGFFQEQDTNKDGFINKPEFLAMGEKKFAEIDANKDGKISPEEQKAHHQKKREKMKERRKEMKEHHEQRSSKEGRTEGQKKPE